MVVCNPSTQEDEAGRQPYVQGHPELIASTKLARAIEKEYLQKEEEKRAGKWGGEGRGKRKK